MAQIGLAPEKWRGTDGAGLRSQDVDPLGEVELVPAAGMRLAVSGLDPLPQQVPM